MYCHSEWYHYSNCHGGCYWSSLEDPMGETAELGFPHRDRNVENLGQQVSLQLDSGWKS